MGKLEVVCQRRSVCWIKREGMRGVNEKIQLGRGRDIVHK